MPEFRDAYWALRATPAVTGVAVLSPSVAIGANVTFFFGFTALAGLVAIVLFGTVPALRAARVRPVETLSVQAVRIAGADRPSIAGALVAVQVALSLPLVVGAGLFARSLSALEHIPLGLEPDSTMIVTVNAERSAVAPDQRLALYERLRDAAAAAPGVEPAGPRSALAAAIGRVDPDVALTFWPLAGRVSGRFARERRLRSQLVERRAHRGPAVGHSATRHADARCCCRLARRRRRPRRVAAGTPRSAHRPRRGPQELIPRRGREVPAAAAKPPWGHAGARSVRVKSPPTKRSGSSASFATA